MIMRPLLSSVPTMPSPNLPFFQPCPSLIWPALSLALISAVHNPCPAPAYPAQPPLSLLLLPLRDPENLGPCHKVKNYHK